ncbi:MAG TPA: hypothetical protein VFX19_12970 [Dehalococcoidia bacterium]|nr:hypothetical protein [Dehalococcoidia bacterium]
MSISAVIREPQADTARQFSARVNLLAGLYALLFVASIAGIVLIVQWGKLLVTLSQRSNVETLTLVFFLAFYLYFILISWRGMLGALRVFYFGLRARIRGAEQGERAKDAALRRPGVEHSVGLNLIIERADLGHEPFRLRVSDGYSELGVVDVDGARLTYIPAYHGSSSELFIFLIHQINLLLRSGKKRRLDIVEWEKIDGEAMEQYVAMVEFARNLSRSLDIEETWPRIVLTEADCRVLEDRLSEICPALRSEAMLPQWEYSGDHKLPLIPEPLGLFSLGVSEKRVDPIASMGAASLIVGATVLGFAFVIALPPWVPGA